jgi:hypothetical protein
MKKNRLRLIALPGFIKVIMQNDVLVLENVYNEKDSLKFSDYIYKDRANFWLNKNIEIS